MGDVRQWLDQHSLIELAEVLEREQIDWSALLVLSESDLKDLGLPIGQRAKLAAALRSLQDRDASVADAISNAPPDGPSNKVQSDVEGARRQLTVMFCDLVGATELSSKLDPEEFRELVRAYQASCEEEVTHFEGHIAQYLGDGLLVYFGHPKAHEDDAARAVRTGLGILEAMQVLNERLRLSLSVRIGIHTGLVVLGKVGAGDRQETLALGDVPNVAARLQNIAVPDSVLISAATQKLVEGLFESQPLGEQSLKGIAEPVPTFRVLATRAMRDRIERSVSLSALVGRDQELGLLTDRWERAVDGQGQVVLLIGEPGIGKSRVVRALDEALASTVHHRAELRCSPMYSQTALYPFIERLPQRFGWESEDSPETEMVKLETVLNRFGVVLEESLPLLAILLSRSPPARYPLPPMSPQRQRRRTLETLVSLLGGMATEKPLLLVVEDLHWADPSTLEVIGQHIEQAPTSRILIVLTARPSFQPPWGARSYLTPLLLNRLTLRQTQAFVLQLAQGKSLPEEVLREIAHKTDGVPLFVEELTKSVLESKLLQDKETRYELAGPLPSLAIPSTLQDSLTARLDRLPKGREVAQVAAALGRNFSFELISAVAGRDQVALAAELDELVNAELLFQKGFGAQASYIFKHALIQDAAYQSLLKSARQRIHRTVASTLVKRFAQETEERPEYVAHQYCEAGLLLESAHYYKLAAERSVKTSAYWEAIAHNRKGIENISALPESVERSRMELALQLGLGMAITPLKGYAAPEAETVYLRASQLAEQVDDKPRMAEALWGLGVGYWVGSNIERGHAVGKRCLQIAEQAGDLDSILAARHCLGCAAMAKGNLVEAHLHFSTFLAQYGDEPRPTLNARHSTDLELNVMHFFAPTLWMLGYPTQAVLLYEALVEKCANTPSLYNRIWGSVSLGQLSAWLREDTKFEDRMQADLALCEEQDMFFMRTVIALQHGGMLVQGSRVKLGIDLIEKSLKEYQAFRAQFSIPVFYSLLSGAYLTVGDREKGLEAVKDGLAISRKNGEFRTDAELHRVRGELLLLGIHRDERAAEAEFLESLQIARAQQAKSLELRTACSLARLWKAQHKAIDGRDLLAAVYDWFTEGFDTKDLKEAADLLAEFNG